MGLCVAVLLSNREQLLQLQEQLAELPSRLKLQAVGAGLIDPLSLNLLNPALDRQQRQRSMARWLLPFGFAAGVMFTFITNLDTFGFAGPIGQPLIGGLLGLGSGWMGSYAAAASVSGPADDQIRTVRNRLEEGLFALLVECPRGETMPWALIQQARPQAVVRLQDD